MKSEVEVLDKKRYFDTDRLQEKCRHLSFIYLNVATIGMVILTIISHGIIP